MLLSKAWYYWIASTTADAAGWKIEERRGMMNQERKRDRKIEKPQTVVKEEVKEEERTSPEVVDNSDCCCCCCSVLYPFSSALTTATDWNAEPEALAPTRGALLPMLLEMLLMLLLGLKPLLRPAELFCCCVHHVECVGVLIPADLMMAGRSSGCSSGWLLLLPLLLRMAGASIRFFDGIK